MTYSRFGLQLVSVDYCDLRWEVILTAHVIHRTPEKLSFPLASHVRKSLYKASTPQPKQRKDPSQEFDYDTSSSITGMRIPPGHALFIDVRTSSVVLDEDEDDESSDEGPSESDHDEPGREGGSMINTSVRTGT
jgi:hypothetical protein